MTKVPAEEPKRGYGWVAMIFMYTCGNMMGVLIGRNEAEKNLRKSASVSIEDINDDGIDDIVVTYDKEKRLVFYGYRDEAGKLKHRLQREDLTQKP